jgi:hypothetical protein
VGPRGRSPAGAGGAATGPETTGAEAAGEDTGEDPAGVALGAAAVGELRGGTPGAEGRTAPGTWGPFEGFGGGAALGADFCSAATGDDFSAPVARAFGSVCPGAGDFDALPIGAGARETAAGGATGLATAGMEPAGAVAVPEGTAGRASRVAGDGGVRPTVAVTFGAAGAFGTTGGGGSPSGDMLGGAGGTSLIGMMNPHFLHFIRTDRPETLSSAIWYFALQLGQRNFIRRDQSSLSRCSLMDSRVASSGASASARSQVSTALLRKPAF